jgi:hypothetical protein
MTIDDKENALPDGAASLIALARVAHRDGNRTLERAAADKLARDYGISLCFTCSESVERDLRRANGGGRGNA